MSEFDDSPSIKAAIAAAAAKGEQPEATPKAPPEFVDTVPATQDATSTENAPPADDQKQTSQTGG